MKDNNLAYLLDGKIYINLTNKCTNDCIFCIRSISDDVCGKNLWLKTEDINACDVIEQIESFDIPKKEVIFCGYGEPLLKKDILIEVAKHLKENYSEIKIRINTNGHANFVWKRDITKELAKYIDEISVSLNAESEELYNELSKPLMPNMYGEVKKFIKACVESGIKTTSTVVNGYKNYKIDVEKCKKISEDLGAKFRVREWLEEGYRDNNI